MNITASLLQAALGCTAERAALWAPHIGEACGSYDIRTPARLAAFFAQIGHESGALHHVREIWGPTPAQMRYEGRADLGNTKPGDGERYKGRGLIQTTGRHNYARVRDRLRQWVSSVPDFEAEPHRLEEPRWAALSAADYWADKGLNALADAGDFEAITRRINGGLNGQADRLARWEKAKAVLMFTEHDQTPAPEPRHMPDPPRPDQEPYTQPEPKMALPAIVAAVLPGIIEAIPKLGGLFGSGSKVSDRNVKAAEAVVEIVRGATGAVNAQDAAEKLKSDPAAVVAATKAIEGAWFDLVEGGGGGIDGARKADADARAKGDLLQSPSFWFTVGVLPLVYGVVGSVVGLWGGEWPSDVRAAIATAVVSLVVGGGAGYYWGQTTSRNRTPLQ